MILYKAIKTDEFLQNMGEIIGKNRIFGFQFQDRIFGTCISKTTGNDLVIKN